MSYTDGSCLHTLEGSKVKKSQRLYTRCQHWLKRRERFRKHRGYVWTSVHLHQTTNEQKRVNGTFDLYIINSLQTVDNKACSVLFGKRDAFFLPLQFYSLLLYTAPSSVRCVNFSYRNEMSLFPYMAIGVASRLMCASLAEARSRLSPFASLFGSELNEP